jgi:hypothetical protein
VTGTALSKLSTLIILASALLSRSAGANTDGYVLGDSIGEGVAIASGLTKLAHISVHIRGPKAIAQINETPVGSVAFIVLGTNDADGSIKNIEKSIDDVVQAGERRKLRMIWLGPPCVRRPFDVQSRELDQILKDRLATTRVTYISMRDQQICSGALQEPDGVHLTMKGYRYMWQKTEAAVSWPRLASTNADSTAGSPAHTDNNDVTGSLATSATAVATGGTSAEALSADDATSVDQMVAEIHRPSHAQSPQIVWTEVTK